MKKIGFIGLGAMGGPMVRQLLKAGYEVFVADLDSDTVAAAAMHGALRCESPAHVADNAEIVLACLPTPEIVQEVLLGDNGVSAGTAVRFFADHSTIGPSAAMSMAARLSEKGILALDAPIAGGVAGANAGTLTVMASGSAEAYRQCEPAFNTFGRHVVHVGEQPGHGQTLKLVNNMIVSATLIATCEAALFGIKAGLDAKMLMDVLNQSTARSFSSEHIVAGTVLDRGFNIGSRIGLVRKDIRLFLTEAEKVGVPTFTASVVKQFFDSAIARGHPADDMTTVVRELEAMARAEIGRTRA